MYIYSIFAKKYNCDGEDPYIALEYILDSVLYNEEFLTTQCFIHPDLCEIIRPILLDHLYKKNHYYCKQIDYTYFMSHAYPITQKTIMFGRIANPAISFFDTIQTILDKNLYLVLSINGWFLKWKEANPDKSYTSDIPIGDIGHVVTIVNYDYSNVANKSFTIKKSWGNSELITITEQELLALTQNTWRITKIFYLDTKQSTKPIVGGKKLHKKQKRRTKKLKKLYIYNQSKQE